MVAEMMMIGWMCGYTRMDRISNGVIRDLVKVVPIEDKLREIRLRWFGHVNIPMDKRGKGCPKKSLDEVIRDDLKVVGLTEDMTQDRRLWRDGIKILDRRELAS